MLDLQEAKLAHVNAAITESIYARYGDEGSEPQKSRDIEPPQLLSWALHDKLIHPPYDTAGRRSRICGNAQDRPGLWARDDPDAIDQIVNPDAPFLNRLAQLCVESKICHCEKTTCVSRRKAIERVAPQCEWPCFRNWAIAAMSCQSLFTEQQQLTRAHTHLVTAASICHWLLIGYKHRREPITDVLIGKGRRPRYQVDLVGVCEIIYWMLTIQAEIGAGNVIEGKWGPEFLPEEVVKPAVDAAWEKQEDMKICANRLWSLANVAERGEADLPGFMEMAQHFPSLEHKGHTECARELCDDSQVDTTTIKQLHKCRDKKCRDEKCCDRKCRDRKCCDEKCQKKEYQMDIVEKSIRRGITPAWFCSKEHTIGRNDPYVAISHVWIDGTGNEDKSTTFNDDYCLVNSCLSDFFIDVVKRKGGNAFWWDTISLPRKKNVRSGELSKMHTYYQNATMTIVHDKYLLDFDWAEDGSPCVALVLSPWFTRGWTALELRESRKGTVKVLFKGPNRSTPYIKDLDTEILAHSPALATRAHWIATSIIKRLRDQPINSVRDLLTILQPRCTSKPKDLLTVAALLSRLPDFDSNDPEQVTTEGIMSHLGKIGHTSLLHGQRTISETGPFSWCPEDIFDMPVDSAGDLEASALVGTMLEIDQRGAIKGNWYYRKLTQADANDGISPSRDVDDWTGKRIIKELRNWRDCILLRENWQDEGKALLAEVVGTEQDTNGDGEIIDCRYVGPVDDVDSDSSVYTSGGYDQRYKYSSIRFGNEKGRRVTSARKLQGYSKPKTRVIQRIIILIIL